LAILSMAASSNFFALEQPLMGVFPVVVKTNPFAGHVKFLCSSQPKRRSKISIAADLPPSGRYRFRNRTCPRVHFKSLCPVTRRSYRPRQGQTRRPNGRG
jgi:hypothetical protein